MKFKSTKDQVPVAAPVLMKEEPVPKPEIDWNECLPWDGEENTLPAGEQTRVPNFRAIQLVRRWEVLDVESEAGFKVIKLEEKQPGDIVIGAQINENSVKKLVETYGPRFFVAYRSDAKGTALTREEWYNTYGTDVLELEALKQMRLGKKVYNIQ